uniref:Uncharacterized protein n=1 Tax=Setaria italica TaxID=4555 RepID=K3YXM7_SETIT
MDPGAWTHQASIHGIVANGEQSCITVHSIQFAETDNELKTKMFCMTNSKERTF